MCVSACAFGETCSCIVPVAFLSRATACEWLMPSAEFPQILTSRSPIWKSESLAQFKSVDILQGKVVKVQTRLGAFFDQLNVL